MRRTACSRARARRASAPCACLRCATSSQSRTCSRRRALHSPKRGRFRRSWRPPTTHSPSSCTLAEPRAWSTLPIASRATNPVSMSYYSAPAMWRTCPPPPPPSGARHCPPPTCKDCTACSAASLALASICPTGCRRRGKSSLCGLAFAALGSGALLRLWEGDVIAGLLAAVELRHRRARPPSRRQPLGRLRIVRARALPEFSLHLEDLDRRLALA